MGVFYTVLLWALLRLISYTLNQRRIDLLNLPPNDPNVEEFL